MQTAIYCRVSTSDQTVEPQLLELRAYATQKKMTVVHEISDVISGTKASREGLDRLMELVRTHEIEAVLCVKLDRMARSLGHFAQIVAEFEKADVALICTSQGIDTSKSNACGRLQMNVLSAVAEFERELIRERTRAGLAVARANGKQLGKPSKIMVPESERAAIVNEWRCQGMDKNYRQLGRMLGGVSGTTAWRVVKKLEAKP